MKDSIYLSRSFVEFGPFTAAELQDFHKRGILKDSDYVSTGSNGEWLHVNEWAASQKAAAAEVKPAAKPVTKAAAPAPAPAPAAAKANPPPGSAKKAPAKKAAKK